MRWIALNDLLQDGDYVDEIYFYNHYPPGVDEDTPSEEHDGATCHDDPSFMYDMYTCADLPSNMCRGPASSSCPVRCGSCGQDSNSGGNQGGARRRRRRTLFDRYFRVSVPSLSWQTK